MLLREIKRIFHHELDTIYPQEEIDSLFYILMDHYLELERFVLALQPNAVVSKEQEQHLFEALSELRSLRPIQYILGKEDFMDLDFRVNEQVLIPRQETEELVRWIIGEYRAAKDGSIKILDIGTGSGCIAISLAKNLPGAEVHALDVSEGGIGHSAGKMPWKTEWTFRLCKRIFPLGTDREPSLTSLFPTHPMFGNRRKGPCIVTCWTTSPVWRCLSLMKAP